MPSLEETNLAKLGSQLLSALISTKVETPVMLFDDPNGAIHSVSVPARALRLFADVLRELGDGNGVRLAPIRAELTLREAADLLNISRPALVRLLDRDAIPSHRIGNRRKLKFADVHTYQVKRKTERLAAMAELSIVSQELGLYDEPRS